MNKLFFTLIFLIVSCNAGNLRVVSDLPKKLHEVSGVETSYNSNLIWVLNDGGNASKLYGLNEAGKVEKTIKIKAKNNDWEDLTSDKAGNLYIGDFGNNANKRKNLAILKIKSKDLTKEKISDIEYISFKYPDQTKFPPKNKNMRFDCEAFFYYKNNLYFFTKSRIKNNFGKTFLYKIPAKGGSYVAEFISSYEACNDLYCWITSADISNDGKTMVLLSPKAILTFSNYNSDNFFSGTVKKQDFSFKSQKEGVCFKDTNTLYITDEKSHGEGGCLYTFKLDD